MNLSRAGVCILAIAIFAHAYGAAGEETPAKLNIAGLEELENGNPESAGEYFLKAIAGEPSNKFYYNNMAASLMRRGDYSDAEVYLKRAVELDSGYARALSNMSVALFNLGRYTESYAYYMRSMRADSRYTGERFEKGRVEVAVRKLLQKKPDDKTLQKILEYIESGD